MDIRDLITNLIYFIIGTGIMGWLIRSVIKLWLDKDIEKYKWKLNKEYVRFSKLYSERAKIIRDLYYKLFDFEQAVSSFVSPVQWAGEKPMKEKLKIVDETGKEFRDYYKKNKIYLSEIVWGILEKIDKIFIKSLIEFTTFEIHDQDSKVLKPLEKMKKWTEIWDKIRLDIPTLRSQLEKEFRQILGVEINPVDKS